MGQVSKVLASPLQRAQHTARLITTYQQLAGSRKPEIETLDSLNNRDWGEWEGKFTTEVRAMSAVTFTSREGMHLCTVNHKQKASSIKVDLCDTDLQAPSHMHVASKARTGCFTCGVL